MWFLSVFSLFVYISTSTKPQFHDSERERGLKKKEGLSLGGRAVSNICYRCSDESGGRDGKNHPELTHTARWGKVETHTEKYITEHLPSARCIPVFSFLFFLFCTAALYLFRNILHIHLRLSIRPCIFPPFSSPPPNIFISICLRFAVSPWKNRIWAAVVYTLISSVSP